MDPEIKYLNTKEAAEKMGVPVDLVRSLCNEGLLPGARQIYENGPWQIPVDAIDTWLELSKNGEFQEESDAQTASHRVIETIRKYLGIRQVTVLGILVGILTIIGLIDNLVGLGLFRLPAEMGGDFRIAIAEFETINNAEDDSIGEELAEGVYLRMQQAFDELSPDFSIELWGPKDAGKVGGQTREARAQAAEELAEKIGADIIVYGLVDTTGPIWSILPEFYLSDNNLVDAQEIKGQHEMGKPFDAAGEGSVATRIEVSKRLSSRARFLSNLTVGLAYYAARDYEEALAVFQGLENKYDWSDIGGKEVLYLLLGNAAGKYGNIDLAENAYLKALDENPEYSRAYSGLGSVYYIRALEPAEDPSQVDVSLLQQSIESLEQARSAKQQPVLADTDSKVHFGLGQAYLMLNFGDGSVPMSDAISEFNSVIEEYGNGHNPRVRELAAESHARLGLIHSINGQNVQAVKEYQEAAALLDDVPERKILYERRIEELGAENSS